MRPVFPIPACPTTRTLKVIGVLSSGAVSELVGGLFISAGLVWRSLSSSFVCWG